MTRYWDRTQTDESSEPPSQEHLVSPKKRPRPANHSDMQTGKSSEYTAAQTRSTPARRANRESEPIDSSSCFQRLHKLFTPTIKYVRRSEAPFTTLGKKLNSDQFPIYTKNARACICKLGRCEFRLPSRQSIADLDSRVDLTKAFGQFVVFVVVDGDNN